jgi:hypothetical protein
MPSSRSPAPYAALPSPAKLPESLRSLWTLLAPVRTSYCRQVPKAMAATDDRMYWAYDRSWVRVFIGWILSGPFRVSTKREHARLWDLCPW